jgi:translation initiation factor eIF-2B subunit delta
MVDARPMALSMSNAVRALRYRISTLTLEVAEHEAQAIMYDFIDAYISNRIDLADKLIIQHGLSKIHDGDVILVYARSVVVRDLLITAREAGRSFKVIVVDSRPFLEGNDGGFLV